jgi:hypothetical protein
MRRGECGATEHESKLYQVIARFTLARNAKDAPYLLNSVSIKDWQPATANKQKATVRDHDGNEIEISGAVWTGEAAELSAAGKLLYDKAALLGDVPDTIRQMVAREVVAIISGHDELSGLWEREHSEWLKRKEQWEAEPEHQRYLALRPRFEEFEQQSGGKAGKRRGRWHLYLAWLKQHPELAAWRGGEAEVHDLSKTSLARINRAKPWKRNAVDAEEFWKANPELHALDRLHGYYEREFVRRRKAKRNPDGFDHRPTFTLPDAVGHPRWFVFNAPQTSPQGYRNLRLPEMPGEAGSIELRLLTGEKNGDRFPDGWVRLHFKADPRLCDFKHVTVQKNATKGSIKGQPTAKNAYIFTDRQLGVERPAQISGVKLILDNIKLNEDGSLSSAVHI